MDAKKNVMLWAAVFAVALPLMFVGIAGSASYKGDGATPNGSGGWALPPVTSQIQCLECHGSGTSQLNKSAYLMTGHKNMLRKVTPGSPWAGADGSIYSTIDAYGSGSIFDWTGGTVDVGGTGVNIQPLYFIFGGWMSADELDTVFNGGFTGELYPNGNYDCARCHTTGYRFSAGGPEPTTYNRTPLSDAQFSRIPTDFASGTSSWYLTGIQCERCHRDVVNEAGGHNCYIGGVYNPSNTSSSSCTGSGGVWTVVTPTFESATALCIECHRQESADTNSQTITLSTDLMVSDGGSCSDGVSPDYATCLAASSTWNYAPFFDASMGQAFLSSPHAKFTGSLAQAAQNAPNLSVSVTGTYASAFTDTSTGKNKGCDGCHDVHQSTVAAVNAAAPINNTCPTCHQQEGMLAYINHPKGPGTPQGDLTDIPGACKTCHMASAYHLFRISVDPAYSTFPSVTDFYAGTQTIGTTAPDGTFQNAVWADIDMACGQCHGGSSTVTQNGAPYFSKLVLAAFAKGMHVSAATSTIPPTVSRTGQTLNGYTVSFTDTSQVFSSNKYVPQPVSVNWGDGKIDHGATGAAFSHTYANGVMRTYTITQLVTDPVNPSLTAKASFSVIVPQRYQLVSHVTNSVGGAVTNVQITLKNAKGYAVQSTLSSSGTATFTSVLPGIYSVGAYKYGVISKTTPTFDISVTPTVTITAP